MKFRFLLVPLWFMLLSACDRWEIGLPEHVLARVNEEEITVEEVNREFNDFLSELGKARVETGLKELKEAYLQQVIERKILVQEARRAGIKVSSDELNQTLLEMKSD